MSPQYVYTYGPLKTAVENRLANILGSHRICLLLNYCPEFTTLEVRLVVNKAHRTSKWVYILQSDHDRLVYQRLTQIGNLWNGGEFYGTSDYNSLVLSERSFEEYPEDADKNVLSIRGGMNPKTGRPDGSTENTRRTLDDSLAGLKGRKKLDLFELTRRDPKKPFETTFSTKDKEYIQTGKLGGISLSEIRAETIHEALKVAKVFAVEVELSMLVIDIPLV